MNEALEFVSYLDSIITESRRTIGDHLEQLYSIEDTNDYPDTTKKFLFNSVLNTLSNLTAFLDMHLTHFEGKMNVIDQAKDRTIKSLENQEFLEYSE